MSTTIGTLKDNNGNDFLPVTDVSLVAGLEDITTIRSGAALGTTAYQKPSAGIPASDLASGMIPDVSGKEDSSNKVTSFQSTPDDTHYPSEKLVKDSLDTKIDNTDVEELTAIDVDNTPTVNSTNLVTSGGVYTAVAAKQNKPTITTVSASTLTQEIADNTIYNAGELSALTITLSNTINADFISEIDFTSGSTATTLTAPNTILWAGDDLTSNVFAPAASKRYTVMFYSDGVSVRGVVQGFATT